MGTKVQKRGMVMFVKVKCCSCRVLMLITYHLSIHMVSERFGRDLYDLCVLRSFEVYLFLGIFIGDLAEIESQRVTARSESACVGGVCQRERNNYRSVHSICMYLSFIDHFLY